MTVPADWVSAAVLLKVTALPVTEAPSEVVPPELKFNAPVPELLIALLIVRLLPAVRVNELALV